MSTHIFIPDTQVRPGVPYVHLGWIGQYLVDRFAGKDNVVIVHAGDHADMSSLSQYDKGKKAMEGRRYMSDIEEANKAWDLLNAPMVEFNRHRVVQNRWWPRKVITLGNHEDRITRAVEANAQLEGALSLDSLNYARTGWEVVPYLQPIEIDGVCYAHFFYNPMTGNAWGGMIENRLQKIGRSFTMGHQQQLLYGIRYTLDRPIHGLVAGACYLHDEDYKGPQGNDHWRGIVVKHEVHDGMYDPMFVSLDYLCRRYEGVTLQRFRRKHKLS